MLNSLVPKNFAFLNHQGILEIPIFRSSSGFKNPIPRYSDKIAILLKIINSSEPRRSSQCSRRATKREKTEKMMRETPTGPLKKRQSDRPCHNLSGFAESRVSLLLPRRELEESERKKRRRKIEEGFHGVPVKFRRHVLALCKNSLTLSRLRQLVVARAV